MTPITSWEDAFDRMRLDLIPSVYTDLPKHRPVELPTAYLARLQKYIRRIYGRGEMGGIGVLVFGLVFGDTLIRNLDGAEWRHPEYTPNTDGQRAFDLGAHEITYRGVTVKPFVRVRKWWDDRTDCLVSMYAGMKRLGDMTEAELSSIPKGRWVAMPDGTKLRVLEADPPPG